MNALVNIPQPVITSGPWFKEWFDSAFYHQLYSNRDEHEAASFIDELLQLLNPAPDARMLDLGCGAGRHARHLAAQGYQVTGLDLAASSIQHARRTAAGNLQFYRHDMRKPFGTARFDYVFNFFTSFGYFKDTVENNRVVNNISNALVPGGTVMIDFLNVEYSQSHMVALEEKEIDGVCYNISRWSDDRFFYKKIIIDDVLPDGPFEITEQVAKLDIADFEYLLSSNGLRIKKVFGDYALNDYDAKTSKRLIIIAKKMTGGERSCAL